MKLIVYKVNQMHQVMAGREIHTKYLLGNLKGSGHLGDLGVDGRIILKWY